MRITFVLPDASMAGGIRVVAIYAQRLQQRGHQVCVVSLARRRPRFRDKARSLIKSGRLLRYAPYGPSYLDQTAVEHRRLKRWRPVVDADVPDADAVVATWWETAEWVAKLSPAKGAKAYFIQHFETWGGDPARVEATWRLPLHKITISNWLAELAAVQFGDPDVTHVPNSVDTSQFFAPPRGKQSEPTIGLMFSTEPFKGCADALAAVARVRAVLPNVRLVLFGKDRPTAALPLPQGAEMTYMPPQEKLREIYARCDVWLCASHAEGFHLPPLEAMACRCPVVSTRVGGPQDILRNGVNGFLVDVGNVQALADRLRHVLGLDETAWRRMSDAALSTATGYTWDDATDLFEAGLNRAIEKNVQRAALV